MINFAPITIQDFVATESHVHYLISQKLASLDKLAQTRDYHVSTVTLKYANDSL